MDALKREHDNLLLQVRGLTKQFGGVRAQDNVSFEVEQGGVLGLIGPNGAGKTTLFNMITGVYAPDKGEILLNGRSINALPVHKRVEAGIARTFQNVELFPGMTVLENVLVGMHVRLASGFWGAVLRLPRVVKEERAAREKALAILEFTGLLPHADRPAGDLPVGRQKTAEIARALAADPKLMLLDEPAAGLNRVESTALGELIRKIKDRGITLMLVEHDMGLAMDVCDKILVLDRGEAIAFATPQQITNDRKVMDAYLGEEFQCLN
ncbi:MAG: ABC transporter ATP-binding protein [Desulfobacteraceae bacterium]|nr:ABC transporter ATP-binding protein [Desulfobacteraceae bacterium]